jgi:trehalose 6-phosphate synthase/phosphatase
MCNPIRGPEENGRSPTAAATALIGRPTGKRYSFALEDAALKPGEIRDSYLEASRRLLIFDYDGTLVPFTKRPPQAAPPPALLDLLRAFAAEPNNMVALLSGRSAENLDRWFGQVAGLYLVAEHGAEIKPPSTSAWEAMRPQTSMEWKSTLIPILEHFVDRTPGSFVEEKKYALVWHYRMSEPEFGEWLANELVSMLEAMLAETELRAFRGEKIVEVKPVWANKAEAFERLMRHFPDPDFTLAAGDDRTDEDLFERLPSSAWTVHVGPGVTRASFVVPDFQFLRRILELLVTSGVARRAS